MGSDEWNRPTKPDGQRDVYFRLGLVMQECARLADRVDALEQLYDEQQRTQLKRRSLRPTVERVGSTAIIAGIVAGILQALAQLLQ